MKFTWITTGDKESHFFKDMAARYNVVLTGDEEILIASDEEDRAAGFSAFTISEGFLDIAFFFVGEAFRDGDCADYMLGDLEATAKKGGAAYIRYMMPTSDALVSYFEKRGFDIFPGKRFYEISIGALYYSKNFRERIYRKDPKGVKSIEDCTPDEHRLLNRFFEQNGIDQEVPFNQKLSNVKIKDGVIRSLILNDTLPSGQITISYVYVEEGHIAYLLDNFRRCSQVLDAYGRRARKLKLLFSTETGSELDLIKYFIEDVGQINEVYLVMTAVKKL